MLNPLLGGLVWVGYCGADEWRRALVAQPRIDYLDGG
tara:strand:+ start:1306 stop:1416 length:111 start_codon:yes stop_codon:yes gene_type:complete